MIMNWTEKYTPQSLKDSFCNKEVIHEITVWLSNFEKRKKKPDDKIIKRKKKDNASCLLISGTTGVGKTTAVNIAINEAKYELQRLNFDNIKNEKTDKNSKKKKKTIKESLYQMITTNNIIDMIHEKKNRKFAIVIDEIEGITATTEKNYIKELMKLNNAEMLCPIILISNNKHNKLLTDIQKNVYKIEMQRPSIPELENISKKVIMGEKIKINKLDIIRTIIDHSQSDIRRLINILRNIKHSYGRSVITPELLEEYFLISKKKDLDPDLYRSTNKLLYNYTSVDDTLQYYETDRVLLPLMVHQNYIRTILDNYSGKAISLDLIQEISDCLSTGDVVENYIYGDQHWNMQEVYGLYTCVIPSFKICHAAKKPMKTASTYFPFDLNRTSIKKINKKNINKANTAFNNLNISDYMYINKIIGKFIEANEIDKCVELLKDYDIQLEHIESLLKIDKVTSTKNCLSSKQKKEFAKYLA